MTVATQSYRPTLLSGRVYMRAEGSTDQMRMIGNVSALDISIEQEEVELPDHTSSGGGTWASATRITGVSGTMTLHDLDRANLAMVLFGAGTTVAAAAAADEDHIARKGGLIPLAHVSPSAVTVTADVGAWAASTVIAAGTWIQDGTHLYEATTGGTTASSEPTWPTTGGTVTDGTVVWTDRGTFSAAADTDYEIRSEGLMILDAGIPDRCPVTVEYTHAGYDAVHALTTTAGVYELRFGGLNRAMDDAAVIVDCYRWQVSPAASLPLLGEEFAAIEVAGKILFDSSKTGTGISRYMDVQIVTS